MSTSAKSVEADVGILGKKNDATLHDTETSDDVEEKDEGPMIASRLDVYNALENAKFIGSSSFGGKADGTKTIPSLPPMSGLFIHDVGKISVPILPSQAKTLKAQSWKTNDDGEYSCSSQIVHKYVYFASHSSSMRALPLLLLPKLNSVYQYLPSAGAQH